MTLYDFPQGIPAFENERRFEFHLDPACEPVGVLRSCATSGLRFLVVPVLDILPGYALEVSREDLAVLGLHMDDARAPQIGVDVECLAILAANDGAPCTVNLAAPVVMNRRTLRGVQAVRVDARYSCCHPLWDAFDQPGCTPDAAPPCL